MSSPDPHGPPEGFVTLAEAVKRLGVSDRTIRRRVQAGELVGEHLPRPQGSVLYVRLPADEPAPHKSGEIAAESTGNSGGDQAALVTALLDRLDTAQAALLAATERAASAEATAAMLRDEVARERAAREAAEKWRWYDPRTW